MGLDRGDGGGKISAEVARRRPILAAVIALCDAHIAAWPDAVAEAAEAAEAAARWDTKYAEVSE